MHDILSYFHHVELPFYDDFDYRNRHRWQLHWNSIVSMDSLGSPFFSLCGKCVPVYQCKTLQMFEPEVNGRPPLHWSRMLHWGVKLQGDYFFGSDPGKRTWHLQIFHWKKRNTPTTQTTKERYAPSLKIPEWNVCRCGEAVIFVWHLCSSDDYVYPLVKRTSIGMSHFRVTFRGVRDLHLPLHSWGKDNQNDPKWVICWLLPLLFFVQNYLLKVL